MLSVPPADRHAVVPYREVVSDRNLTDDDWSALLDGKDLPPVPAWLAPFAAPLRAKPEPAETGK